MNPPNLPPIVRQTKTPSCEEDRLHCIQELSDWADQYRNEVEKESSARAAQIESLLIAGDYEAIREWLQEWEGEDLAPGSLRQRYARARSELRQERFRQRQRQLYGSVIDKITGASTDSLTGSGAELHSQTSHESIGDFLIMPTISTSVKTLGYYVTTLPDHIEEELGAHFENLSKTEQYTLLAVFAGYMASVAEKENYEQSLGDIYNDVPGYLPSPIADLLSEIEDLERLSNGTILALTEALVLNIHYTHVEEE